MSDYASEDRGVVRAIVKGLWRRVAGTVALLTGGLLFLILYLGFEAPRLPWYENTAVVLSALFLLPVLLIVMWVTWVWGAARRVERLGGVHVEFD